MRSAAVLALFVLTGCAGVPFGPPQPRHPAERTDAVICADPLTGAAEGAPEAGTVPDGFEPVAILRCDAAATEEDAEGVWAGVAIERLEGDLEPLLEALSGDNDARTSNACAAMMVVAPDLWAADAAGRVIRLSFPATGCSQPKEDAMAAAEAALAELRVVERSFTRGTLVESRAAADAGCASQAGVLVLAGQPAAQQPELLGAGQSVVPEEFAVIPEEPPTLPQPGDVDGLLVCAYEAAEPPSSVPVPAGDAGRFVGAERRDAAQAREVLDLAAGAAPFPDACAAPAGRFVVAHPIVAGRAASAALTVELDGCGRLIGPDLRPLTATPALQALLAPR